MCAPTTVRIIASTQSYTRTIVSLDEGCNVVSIACSTGTSVWDYHLAARQERDIAAREMSGQTKT